MLLATHEDEATVSVPEAASVAVAAAEPQPAVAVNHREDGAAAVRVDDGFHCDAEPFIFRLVAIREAQGWSDFGGTKLEPHLHRTGGDVVVAGSFLEAEIGNGEDDEVHIRLLLCAGEGGLAEDVVCPVADATTCRLECLAVLVGVLPGPELHGLPDRQVADRSTDREFTTEETLDPPFATLLSEQFDDVVQFICRVLH